MNCSNMVMKGPFVLADHSAFFEKITEPEDLEIGTLAYMVNNGKVAIWNEADRERINFLREIRNRIAHGKCCSPEELGHLFAIAE